MRLYNGFVVTARDLEYFRQLADECKRRLQLEETRDVIGVCSCCEEDVLRTDFWLEEWTKRDGIYRMYCPSCYEEIEADGYDVCAKCGQRIERGYQAYRLADGSVLGSCCAREEYEY